MNKKIDNKKYWKEFYKGKFTFEPSSFAKFVFKYIKGDLVELGCGNGRDTDYFKSNKIKALGIDEANGVTAESYMRSNPSPKNVYTRFFWHSISRRLQLQILKWAKGNLFIEARTTDDAKRLKFFPKHDRNYVNIAELVKDLKDNGFEIVRLEEGLGFSKFKKEDPHLVRVIAVKK